MIALSECNQGASIIGIMLSLWLVIVIAVVCLVLGFIIGTRGRKMMQALAALAAAAKMMLQGQSTAAPGAPDAGAADDLDEDDEDEKKGEEISIDDFLSREPGLDLHPELEINPIMMYHIKIAKEEARKEMAVKAFQAEGLTDEEIAERMAMAELTGGGGGGGGAKKSALQTMVDFGARVTSVTAGGSSEQAALNDLRRNKKNIDVYLAKSMYIDTTLVKVEGTKQRRVERKGNDMSAAEKANDLKENPFGGETLKRAQSTASLAKSARQQLPVWQTKLLREAKIKNPADYEEHERRGAGGGGGGLLQLNASDLSELSQLAAETMEDEEDEEGEEGEEGEDEGLEA